MARLPTTLESWRLRASIVATGNPLTGDGDADVGEELRRLRNRWSESVSSVTEEDALRLCEPIFFETWAAFSRLPSRHPLRLRQLYRGDDLEKLLRYFLGRCLRLERVCKGQGTGISGTGHLVLGGPLGAGKTYLLRGLAFVVAALCEHVLPVSHALARHGLLPFYEGESQEPLATMVPVSTLLRAASACVNGTITDAASYSTWLRANSAAANDIARNAVDDALAAVGDSSQKAGLLPMLLLDEVNLLYRMDRYAERGKLVIREIQQLGRFPNVSVTASGSISNFRDHVFALGRWNKYPPLNSTMFHFEEVQPLRNAASMRDYLSATGMNAPTGLSADDMLSLTGGVARVIATVCECGVLMHPVGRLHPINTLRTDPMFRLAMSVMLDRVDGASVDEYPHAMGMPEAAMVDMLHRAGYTPECVASSLQLWRDGDLLLLRSSDGMLQLLYPYHARLLWAELNAGDMKLVTQARMQLHGAKPSIGNALATLVRPHLDQLFIGGMQRHGNLVTIDKAAHYSRGVNDASPLVPSECVGEIVGWAEQVGLEDFALFRDPNDATTVFVDGWQCDSPAVGTIAKWGNFDTAVRAVVAAKAVHCLNPATYASHAVVKALWGFCALIGILSAARGEGDSTAYVPRQLYLRTTAVLDTDAASKLQEPFSFPVELVQAFGRSSKAKSLGLEGVVLTGWTGWHLVVEAKDGLDWLRSVLPQPTYSLVLTEALDARERKCRERVDGAA